MPTPSLSSTPVPVPGGLPDIDSELALRLRYEEAAIARSTLPDLFDRAFSMAGSRGHRRAAGVEFDHDKVVELQPEKAFFLSRLDQASADPGVRAHRPGFTQTHQALCAMSSAIVFAS